MKRSFAIALLCAQVGIKLYLDRHGGASHPHLSDLGTLLEWASHLKDFVDIFRDDNEPPRPDDKAEKHDDEKA